MLIGTTAPLTGDSSVAGELPFGYGKRGQRHRHDGPEGGIVLRVRPNRKLHTVLEHSRMAKAGIKPAHPEVFLPEHNAVRHARWARTLQQVSQYKLDYGHLPGDDTPESSSLRQWLGRQRAKETSGTLSPVQVQALDSMDGDWRVNRNNLNWENQLLAAVLDYRETGHVPRNTDAGRWLTRQRSRMSAGKLTGDQLAALDELIPGWRNLDRLRWTEQAEALAEYAARAGRLPSSRTAGTEARCLYTWLARQRQLLRGGTLAADRIAELDSLMTGWRPAPRHR